jgi:hypothetical protein
MHHGPDRPPECRRIEVILRGALLCSPLALGGCDVVKEVAESLRSPPAPFDKTAAPPAPDYAKANAWLAFPGRDGAERSTPQGIAAIDEASAPADLFFVHPTSSLTNDVWNAPYDARAPYNPRSCSIRSALSTAAAGCMRRSTDRRRYMLWTPACRRTTSPIAISKGVPLLYRLSEPRTAVHHRLAQPGVDARGATASGADSGHAVAG